MQERIKRLADVTGDIRPFCPLIGRDCRDDGCAWWACNRCALAVIAYAIKSLDERGIEVITPYDD